MAFSGTRNNRYLRFYLNHRQANSPLLPSHGSGSCDSAQTTPGAHARRDARAAWLSRADTGRASAPSSARQCGEPSRVLSVLRWIRKGAEERPTVRWTDPPKAPGGLARIKKFWGRRVISHGRPTRPRGALALPATTWGMTAFLECDPEGDVCRMYADWGSLRDHLAGQDGGVFARKPRSRVVFATRRHAAERPSLDWGEISPNLDWTAIPGRVRGQRGCHRHGAAVVELLHVGGMAPINLAESPEPRPRTTGCGP